MGGRAHVLPTPESRDALLDLVLRPLVERYGEEPTIFAWDIINEPEWIKTVDADELRGFLSDSVALIHSAPVIQRPWLCRARWRDRYAGLELDFYQVHWYDKLEAPAIAGDAGFMSSVSIGLCCSESFPREDRSERPTTSSSAARAAGYSGAFYWSVLAKDECSEVRLKPDTRY